MGPQRASGSLNYFPVIPALVVWRTVGLMSLQHVLKFRRVHLFTKRVVIIPQRRQHALHD